MISQRLKINFYVWEQNNQKVQENDFRLQSRCYVANFAENCSVTIFS